MRSSELLHDQDKVTTPMLASTDIANGSSGANPAADMQPHCSSPIAITIDAHRQPPPPSSSNRRSMPLFERASSRWWNPQFASPFLESQYWKCSFPQLRDRFRSGLVYICLTCVLWIIYLIYATDSSPDHRLFYQLSSVAIMAITLCMFMFTLCSRIYQRFYLPTSFLCTFLLCVVTLLVFSISNTPLISPIGTFATSVQVILLVYTVIPLPLYLCIAIGFIYSGLYEMLSSKVGIAEPHGIKIGLHICVHLLGVHLFVLTQVRQRRTFLKVGQSLLARRDLELETQFKDHMIQSVMPKKVAEELLQSNEQRRPSASFDIGYRTAASSAGGGTSAATATVRKFRPFTMNLMTDVSILFADIAGFTKMSTNKSADELVNLLNDLFGRFDHLCTKCNLEKISTLGDCYYCVAGCPEPRPDHAKCCVEMGLAMIDAIRQFDIDRGQQVNMRVGIHTGKVMCGMVGTRRFKFDVFSNDVTLANEMESTGVAGLVHISEATARYLTPNDEYLFEDGQPYKGMKTYFISGRTNNQQCDTSVASDTVTATRNAPPDAGGLRSQLSFRKKLASKFKSIHASSLPVRGGTPSSGVGGGGGSLRMKLIEKEPCGGASVEILPDHQQDPSHRKSTSLQALTSTNYTPITVAALVSSPADRCLTFTEGSSSRDQTDRMVGRELANGSSAGNSTAKGSRSSGLQDAGSELHSMGGLDTAISHHHAAASLTRFDTDNRDFDRRLADAIQQSSTEIGVDQSYWIHRDALNPWTLRFKDAAVETQYRAHFAVSADRNAPRTRVVNGSTSGESDDASASQYRYSGVFVDILVAGAVFAIVAAVAFISFEWNFVWQIYFIIAVVLVFIAVTVVGIPLLRRRSLVPCVNQWTPRHLIGLILIALPSGAALCNLLTTTSERLSPADAVVPHLICGYILLITIFCHSNFSQLGCWPKTFQAAVFGMLLFGLCHFCVNTECAINSINDNNQSSIIFGQKNHHLNIPLFSNSSIYIWEVLLDVLLALVLIAFLNYQFEAGFRVSFYGDLQARRDTQQMQSVRDQADWLLNNIIPQHAVEELKVNTKYSENHAMTAVLFASITNWNEMYEENFEGGREFLRVLNEVIGDFDELLDRPEFCQVEKIKTIGATYMAASGLNPERRRLAQHPYEHLYQLIEFALAIQEALALFNQDLLNFDFVCELGVNIGPVTAGVIGTTKLYYDIWGDTVNIASRMYSTGVLDRIQVSKQTRDLLRDRYEFQYRDRIDVKGIDGGMETYLLTGRRGEPPLYPSINSTTSNAQTAHNHQ